MAIFEALVDPNRRAILDRLLDEEQSVGELVSALSIGQPTVSKHLKTLRSAGLVSVRVDANRRLYRLQPEPLAELDAWLRPYRQRWASRLDALEEYLDATDPRRAASRPADRTTEGNEP